MTLTMRCETAAVRAARFMVIVLLATALVRSTAARGIVDGAAGAAGAVGVAGAVGADGQDAGPAAIRIERKGGPATIPDVPRDEVICFALYTVQDGVLKLSAQLYPLAAGESRQVVLEVRRDGGWAELATAEVDDVGWLATFRLDGWDASRDHDYRLTHAGGARYEGRIRRDPIDKDEIVLAALSCNSNSDRGMRDDIVRNLRAIDPDVLFFAGDQSYDHRSHTAAWLLFGRQFGDVIRDRPTVTIPDDHDVGQGNLWGAGGKVARLRGGADGGYRMPADYVNMVQRAQTSHLPDPYDATPVRQGISVYYTSLTVGGIDFAILEDRKWKSGPAGLIPQQGPRPDHINDPDYDRASVDVPEARLLGDRQLDFLDHWSRDWEGVSMKAVLSQTIFAGGAHIHGSHDARLLADLDSNGWPQSGRDRALRAIRKGFAVHIAGDQHLATVIRHGVNSWEDASYSFCVPSIVNYYGRWWWPLEDPIGGVAVAGGVGEADLPFVGRYHDGFGNKVTMLAYVNPTPENTNGSGFGIVRFRKASAMTRIECWPRHIDVESADARQFAGWPVEFAMTDNYARRPLAHLPRLEIGGAIDPVVQIIDEALDEVVYTLRIRGTSWRPGVFRQGVYTVRVLGGGGRERIVRGVTSIAAADEAVLKFEF